MGALELLALVAIVLGLGACARHFLGMDPFGRLLESLAPMQAANSATPVQGAGAGVMEASLDDIDHGLKDLAEHIGAVRHLAEERGAEIERYREGYNFSITRSLARGVIKTVDMLGDFRQQLEEVHSDADSELLSDALMRLEAASAQLEMLLEANQVEAYWPETGVSVESASQRFEPVEVRPTTDPEQHGRVAEVKYPGWILVRGDADERVIREAQVSVFGPDKQGVDS